MVSSTGQTMARGDQVAHVKRPARALIGWMSQEEGPVHLAGRQVDKAADPELIARADAARTEVSNRAKGVDQTDLLTDIPGDLDEHVQKLLATEEAAPFAGPGWSVKMADLTKVCALQPSVFWDHAEERAAVANPDSIKSIAEVTLPLPTEVHLPVQYDSSRMTWMVTSRNPNLKFVGQFSTKLKKGVVGFGFGVAILPSFVQVVLHRGRYLLRDGYHRSLGLLARGITRVPVFHREYSEYENIGLGPGMLAAEQYLGDRPPLLADYLDDEVSAEVMLPASQKMVVVQGLEMNPIG